MSAQTVNTIDTHPHVVAWLDNYKGDFDFYLSLKNQLASKGYLSEKQIACVERAIAKEDSEKKEKVLPDFVPTYPNGSVLSLTRATATRLAAELGLNFSYRNIEIVKTHRETEKGILVDFIYSSKVGALCSICGRPLTDEVSCASGVGPDCAKRLGIVRREKTTSSEIVREIEKMFEAIGEIKSIWLPKMSVTLQSENNEEEPVTILEKPNRYGDPTDY